MKYFIHTSETLAFQNYRFFDRILKKILIEVEYVLFMILRNRSHCIFYHPWFIWQKHDTEQETKKTFSGQCSNRTNNDGSKKISQNMWVCLFILIQKGYCYHCMTKPVVAIYNVSKTIPCVYKFCPSHIRMNMVPDCWTLMIQLRFFV